VINFSKRARRLLTPAPFPLESPGALGYSPLSSFPSLSYRRCASHFDVPAFVDEVT
jgi:hypothetical protein